MTREELIELAAGAHRERSGRGEIRESQAWHDLDEAGRIEAFDAALEARQLEAAADSQGLSTTARAVLAAIQRQ